MSERRLGQHQLQRSVGQDRLLGEVVALGAELGDGLVLGVRLEQLLAMQADDLAHAKAVVPVVEDEVPAAAFRGRLEADLVGGLVARDADGMLAAAVDLVAATVGSIGTGIVLLPVPVPAVAVLAADQIETELATGRVEGVEVRNDDGA